MYKDFLDYLSYNREEVFIEAEARADRMKRFISEYNIKYHTQINLDSQGICLLGDVDKWGVELRLYFNNLSNIPPYWNERKYVNRKYRSTKFAYRIDDNDLVWFLFDNGYRVGCNSI